MNTCINVVTRTQYPCSCSKFWLLNHQWTIKLFKTNVFCSCSHFFSVGQPPGHKGRRNRPGACLRGLILFPRIRWVLKKGGFVLGFHRFLGGVFPCLLVRYFPRRACWSTIVLDQTRAGLPGAVTKKKKRGNFDRSCAGPSIGSRGMRASSCSIWRRIQRAQRF